MGNDAEQNVLFHDRIAPAYDAQLTGRTDDIRARAAFQELVTRHVAPGSTLLDFGCGTGLDAVHYSSAGYQVIAYDNSPGMIQQLRRKCSVESFSFDYSQFAENLAAWPSPNAVVANFAVLNHIRDIDAWFETIARHLAPPGWVIVSVLNPIHWTHLTAPRWWSNALKRGPRPHSREPITYLHSIGSIVRAAPAFRLVGSANAGSLIRYDERDGERLWWGDPTWSNRLLWQTPARRFLGHFVFLVFRRDA